MSSYQIAGTIVRYKNTPEIHLLCIPNPIFGLNT